MENKCNKTPNNNNTNKYYCNAGAGVVGHSSIVTAPENKNFIRANTITTSNGGGVVNNNSTVATNGDILALFKENKQLKAMLILHLELIQEQSDQLVAKDKQLASQNEELENLRASNKQMAEQVQELQNQLHRQLKRNAFVGELTSLPPPPLAKIQCKPQIIRQTATPNLTTIASRTTTTTATNVIGECNGKLISKIILHRVSANADGEGTLSPNSCFTVSAATTSTADNNTTDGILHKDDDEIDEVTTEGEQEEDDIDPDLDIDAEVGVDLDEASTEDSNDTDNNALAELVKRKQQQTSQNLIIRSGAKPRQHLPTAMHHTTQSQAATATTTTNPVQICVTPSTPSRGKQMSMMLWHMPEAHSDESASCDSMPDVEQHPSSLAASPTTVSTGNISPACKRTPTRHAKTTVGHTRGPHAKLRRCAYITTPQLYCTREWEDEAANVCDYEFTKEDASALHVDAPMLEIPKWTEHELSVSYCIEGTEDLSDDIFLKRHAKLEVDEKRRKKWDVQQIREQRRIEKLKRRHCKDELQNPLEQKPPMSFYPQVDALETICYMNDLPVQAFGEMIPKFTTNADFVLPWLEAALAATINENNGSNNTNTSNSVETLAEGTLSSTSAKAQAQILNSTFVFLKKRRRQQSSSSRQRNAVAKAAPHTTNLATLMNSTAIKQQQQQQPLTVASGSSNGGISSSVEATK